MKRPQPSPAQQELIRMALAPPPSAENIPKPSTAKAPKPNKTSRPNRKPPSRPPSQFKSKIIKWDDQKGFGFVLHEKRELFIHCNDFAERHKRPEDGDTIHYQLGKDDKGRPRAVQARHHNDGGKITLFNWICVTLLAAVPTFAALHFLTSNQFPLFYFFIPATAINLLTYLAYKKDKQQARKKQWRTSEQTLHFLELSGGWPAAYLAQHQFRHKCSKTWFQCIYRFIIFLHLFFAIEYLSDWHVSLAILDAITQ